jgi:DNA-3-methyladenine glycosylase I
MPNDKARCPWPSDDPQMVAYHDEEWGRPERDSRALFAKLILDGFQAGLSWRTILHKRTAFDRAFAQFNPEKIARFNERDIKRLLADAGIVRHRGKIEATISNARAYLAIEEKEGFAPLLWSFVNDAPIVNQPKRPRDIPTETKESRAMSKALRAHEFRFVGPTICYAFMQATGMVDDHLVGCFRK